MPHSDCARFAENLAAALFAHGWELRDLRNASALAAGRRYSWANSLIKRLLGAFPEKPAFPDLLKFLHIDKGLNRVCHKFLSNEGHLPVGSFFSRPRPSWATGLPDLPSSAALATWLDLSPNRLDWLADPAGRNRLQPPGPLRTYRYRWVLKRTGKARLLEIPTPLLKRVQRRLLADLLNLVPPHPAAHGFCPGRSPLTNATQHCGREAIIGFDLKDFFPSVTIGKVFALYRTLGYSEQMAKLLTGLCTTRLPRDIWAARPNPPLDGSDHPQWQRFATRHLPQGAPSSPAIANLVAYRLDCRLAGLATDLDATYTRYADDLTFSGGSNLARSAKRLTVMVAQIAIEEGFMLNHSKSRVQRQGGQQCVTGIVVNTRPNSPRRDFEQLKAILTNCVRHGPATQNRENKSDFRAYLMGKVAHVGAINRLRGQKLWSLFDRIVWPK
jgi:RNA-directed DNA polymerase